MTVIRQPNIGDYDFDPQNAEYREALKRWRLRWFAVDHLPLRLREVSVKFLALAEELYDLMPEPAHELSVALRKLLEGKDAAVRAWLEYEPGTEEVATDA